MSDILRIIEKYKSGESDTLTHPDLAQDITALSDLMATATKDEKEKAEDFLKDMEQHVDAEIEKLKGHIGEKPQAMETLRKNAEACLAYAKNKTPRK